MANAVVSAVVGFLLTFYLEPLFAKTLAPQNLQLGASATSLTSPPPVHGVKLIDEVATMGDKRAGLRIAILDAEHYWPLGRADTIVGPGGREEDVFAFFNSSGIQKRIAEAEDIIAIGTASCEDDTRSEEARAQDRAYKLINWARQLDSLGQNAGLFTVNLGQYLDPSCDRKAADQTRHQRNAILVAVMFKENVDDWEQLGILLKKHLMREDGLDLDVDSYSRPSFVLNRRD